MNNKEKIEFINQTFTPTGAEKPLAQAITKAIKKGFNRTTLHRKLMGLLPEVDSKILAQITYYIENAEIQYNQHIEEFGSPIS